MLNSSLNTNPPNKNEFEISLFGPGVGECIVAHLGDGEWMIVDSCLNPSSKNPIAIDYLENLHVDPSSSVKVFVISHWHSDHISGASKIVEICRSARVCYSAALLKSEFLSFVGAFSGIEAPVILDKKRAATREMASITKILKKRCESEGGYKNNEMVPIIADRTLYNCINNGFSTSVLALSPSDKSFNNALIEFASLMPKVDDMRKILPVISPNNNAIVLWIKSGDVNILLGSDLEQTNDNLTGWRAILNSPVRPKGRAVVFKIPHHGSITAHSHEVWKEMVSDQSLAILTSKIGGRNSIPKASDIKRLKKYTDQIYCTKEPTTKKIKRDPTIEKAIKEMVKDRKVLGGEIGQIQVRVSKNNYIKIGLKQPASKL